MELRLGLGPCAGPNRYSGRQGAGSSFRPRRVGSPQKEPERRSACCGENHGVTRKRAAARTQLVDLLGTVAGYNDKGYQWSGHDAEQVRQYRSGAQHTIMALVAEIGEAAFSADLLKMLRSGDAVEDGSGQIHDRAQAELLGEV